MSKRLEQAEDALIQAEDAPNERYETFYFAKSIALSLVGILEQLERNEKRRNEAVELADRREDMKYTLTYGGGR